MYKYVLTFFLTAIMLRNADSQSRDVWMLGPMLHFNFGNKEMHTSFGIELSYWNYTHFPYSIDGGFEFEKKKTRFYSEVQTGIGLLGISIGPVLELQADKHKLKAGVQGSAWANYFGGFDLRFRKVKENSYISPGLYFKIPLVFGGESNASHHHWDWDD